METQTETQFATQPTAPDLPREFVLYLRGRTLYTERFVLIEAIWIMAQTYRLIWKNPTTDTLTVPDGVAAFRTYGRFDLAVPPYGTCRSVVFKKSDAVAFTTASGPHPVPILTFEGLHTVYMPPEVWRPHLPRNRSVVVTSSAPIISALIREAVTIPVARIIVAHARAQGEQCPIAAEAFVDGGVAVMPCGHLFSKDALECCFAPLVCGGECPVCRQQGVPCCV